MSMLGITTVAPNEIPHIRDAAELSSHITRMEELAAYLSDLAVSVPEHTEMLYRLSDKATREAEMLRNQLAALPQARTSH